MTKNSMDEDHCLLPAPDCDVLLGGDVMIARWLGWTLEQVRESINAGDIPIYHRREIVFAFKSEIIMEFRAVASEENEK